VLRNYLLAALRNLRRNRAYAAINVIGLVVGFAAATLIALYVRDEYSYDRFFPEHERTYRVTESLSVPGQATIRVWVSPSSPRNGRRAKSGYARSWARADGTSCASSDGSSLDLCYGPTSSPGP